MKLERIADIELDCNNLKHTSHLCANQGTSSNIGLSQVGPLGVHFNVPCTRMSSRTTLHRIWWAHLLYNHRGCAHMSRVAVTQLPMTASTQSKLYKVIAFSKATLRCCLAVTSERNVMDNVIRQTLLKRTVQWCLNGSRWSTLMSVDLDEPTWTWIMPVVTYIEVGCEPKNGVWSFLVISDREEVSSVCFTVLCWKVSKKRIQLFLCTVQNHMKHTAQGLRVIEASKCGLLCSPEHVNLSHACGHKSSFRCESTYTQHV